MANQWLKHKILETVSAYTSGSAVKKYTAAFMAAAMTASAISATLPTTANAQSLDFTGREAGETFVGGKLRFTWGGSDQRSLAERTTLSFYADHTFGSGETLGFGDQRDTVTFDAGVSFNLAQALNPGSAVRTELDQVNGFTVQNTVQRDFSFLDVANYTAGVSFNGDGVSVTGTDRESYRVGLAWNPALMFTDDTGVAMSLGANGYQVPVMTFGGDPVATAQWFNLGTGDEGGTVSGCEGSSCDTTTGDQPDQVTAPPVTENPDPDPTNTGGNGNVGVGNTDDTGGGTLDGAHDCVSKCADPDPEDNDGGGSKTGVIVRIVVAAAVVGGAVLFSRRSEPAQQPVVDDVTHIGIRGDKEETEIFDITSGQILAVAQNELEGRLMAEWLRRADMQDGHRHYQFAKDIAQSEIVGELEELLRRPVRASRVQTVAPAPS